MQRMCGSEWSGSLVHDGDLLPCIQALLVRIPPPLLIMLPVGAWRLWTLRHRSVRVERPALEPRVAFLCVALQVLLSLLSFIFSLATTPQPYEVFEGLATLGGWSASLGVLYRERRCQLRLHPASRIYWAVDFLTSTKALESAIWSMARGNEIDDAMLLSILRWPLAGVLLYFSLAWRSRGYDDNAEPEMSSAGSTQGGVLRKLRSPREYIVVERDEEGAWGETEGAARPDHPQGLWGRFMQFAKSEDEGVERVDMSLRGVKHVDSGSFLRVDSPLPRPLPMALGPPMAAEALRLPRMRDPTTHPLYQAEVLVPSVTESMVRQRSVVQFSVQVRVRAAAFASGDESIDTVTVWKKAREFEGLHDVLQLTASKYDTVTVPEFTPYNPTKLELSRHNFELFLQAVLAAEPVLWNDVADWIRLPEKLELMSSHAEFMKRKSPVGSYEAGSTLMASLGSSPAESTVAAGTSVTVAVAPIAPASSSPSLSNSRSASAVPYGWLLIGVSVHAWMRWMSATAAAAAASSSTAQRTSSSQRASIPAIDEEDEDEDANAAPAAAPAAATYVTFDIRVRSSLGEWHVHKKMSEMQALRAELVDRFTGIPVPNLSVDSDYDKDDASLNQARLVLEVFLQSVVGTSFFECPQLYTCLAEQSHPVRRITEDRMVACSDPALLPPGSSSVAPAAPRVSALSSALQRPKSDSVNIAPPRKSRTDKHASSGGGGSLPASSLSDAPLGSSLLSQSISAAEDYFGANAASSSVSPTPESSAPTAPMAAPPRHPQSHRGRTPSSSLSVSRRGVNPSPNQHFASSYLESDDAFPPGHPGARGGGAGASGSSSGSDDEDASDSVDDSSDAGDDDGDSVLDQHSSGVLPSVGSTLGVRPTGNHRFAVFIPSWTFARVDDDSASSATAVSSSPSTVSASAPSSKSGSQQHVVFTVVIREFFDLTTYLEWSVSRRFQQFDRLHRALKAQFPSLALPELPPKTMFGKKQNKAFLDARQQQLEIYVQQLINNTTFQVDEFFSFFDMNKSDRQITMGNLAAPTA